MNDNKIKKLKKKVWVISTGVLLIYVGLLIANPTALIALLPIIITSGALTIGLPAYDIYKNINYRNNNKNKTQEYIKNIIADNNIKKDKVIDNYKEEIVINNDDILDRPKVKRKGTIN